MAIFKGPSINDATSKGEGGDGEKVILGDFQGITGVTRGGRGSKNWKFGVASFMDCPLVETFDRIFEKQAFQFELGVNTH